MRRTAINIGASVLMALAFVVSCTRHQAENDASVPDGVSATRARQQAEPPVQTIVIPSGTGIPATLDTRLSTETNVAGDRFTATIADPIVIGGRLVVPAGSLIHGMVRNVQTSGRINGRAEMTLAFQEIVDVEGKRNAISALPLTLQADSERRDVDDMEQTTTDGISDRRPRATSSVGSNTAAGAGAGAVLVLPTQGGFIELDAGRRLNIQMTGPAHLTLAAQPARD